MTNDDKVKLADRILAADTEKDWRFYSDDGPILQAIVSEWKQFTQPRRCYAESEGMKCEGELGHSGMHFGRGK